MRKRKLLTALTLFSLFFALSAAGTNVSMTAVEPLAGLAAASESYVSETLDHPTPISIPLETIIDPTGGATTSPGPAQREDSLSDPLPAMPENGIHWESSLSLSDIVDSLQNVLPESWEVTVIRHNELPRKWEGIPEGICVKVEDLQTIVHHPNGFDYHPFYKLWLCPPNWKGKMCDVEYLEEQDHCVLLGQNHKMKVFYLTLGANNWPEGPERLRDVLDLTCLPITTCLRQRIEPSMRVKLFPHLAISANGQAGLLDRLVGMEIEGPLAYVEYATATDRKLNGHRLPSRCKEPGVKWLIEQENLFLAKEIFIAYPDVRTIYVRRVCDEFMSDRIIDRSDEISESSVILINSSY